MHEELISVAIVVIAGLSFFVTLILGTRNHLRVPRIFALLFGILVAVEIIQAVRLMPAFLEQRERVNRLYADADPSLKQRFDNGAAYEDSVCFLPPSSVAINVQLFCSDAARNWDSLEFNLRFSWLIFFMGHDFSGVTDHFFLYSLPSAILILPVLALLAALGAMSGVFLPKIGVNAARADQPPLTIAEFKGDSRRWATPPRPDVFQVWRKYRTDDVQRTPNAAPTPNSSRV